MFDLFVNESRAAFVNELKNLLKLGSTKNNQVRAECFVRFARFDTCVYDTA